MIMLFRTVYGPELEAIYQLVLDSTERGIDRDGIIQMFLPLLDERPSTQSIDDAVHFLVASRMIRSVEGYFLATTTDNETTSFRLLLLKRLRRLQEGHDSTLHSSDAIYLALLDRLFVLPNRRFVPALHVAANELDIVTAIGGLNREKIQAWARVMAFLGLGKRVNGGFLFLPSPQLMVEILLSAQQNKGILQSFVEEHLATYLPCVNQEYYLSTPFESALLYLYDRGMLSLYSLQDSPSRPYFGTARYRGYSLLEPMSYGVN